MTVQGPRTANWLCCTVQSDKSTNVIEMADTSVKYYGEPTDKQ
jgi:hypothetical protein